MNNRPQTVSPTKTGIAICAYLIWEKEGRPHGRDWQHWFEAEEQLRVNSLSETASVSAADLRLLTNSLKQSKPPKASTRRGQKVPHNAIGL